MSLMSLYFAFDLSKTDSDEQILTGQMDLLLKLMTSLLSEASLWMMI